MRPDAPRNGRWRRGAAADRLAGIASRSPSLPWSWPAFAAGVVAALLLTTLLWLLLRLVVVAAGVGALALAAAWLLGQGGWRWPPRWLSR